MVLFQCDFFFYGVVRFNVFVEDLYKFLDNLIAFQGGEQASVDVDRSFWFFERAG